jgi:anti-sigma factor RsiW
MLSDRHCQLLTAYVDGELTARQRRAVDGLVQRSAEARAFLEDLQSDSAELRSLPPRKAPATLAEKVLGTLSDVPRLPVQPVRPAVIAQGSGMLSTWLGLAAAACVLVMVGVGTYLLFGLLLGDKVENREVKKDTPPPPQVPVLDPLLADLFGGAAERFGANVDAKEVYVRVAVGQLVQAPARERLAKALKKDAAVHVVVPVINSATAVARLQDAFKKNGITVLVDGPTKSNLKKPGKGVSFVLYVENLKAEEMAQIFENVGHAEATGLRRARTIDVVDIKGMTLADRHGLSKLLGVAVKDLEPSIDWSPLVPIDPKNDSKNNGKVQPVERFALVLAQGSNVNPAKTKQMLQFLAARKGVRPDMLQVVFTIQEAAI